MKRILSLALALLGGALAAENLLPDGDFLFGTASYMLGDNRNYVPVPHRVVPSGDAHGNILEISPESGRISALYLPEVPFRRDCEYELSFSAKSRKKTFSVTVSEYNNFSGLCGSWGIKSFRVTPQWKRHVYRFRPDALPPWKVPRFKADEKETMGGFRLLVRENFAEGETLSLSNLYLGPVGGETVRPEVSGAFQYGGMLRRFDPGTSLAVPLELLNRSASGVNAEIKWNVKDTLSGKSVLSGSFRKDLPQGKTVVPLTFTIPERNMTAVLEATVNGSAVLAPFRFASVPAVRTPKNELPIMLGIDGFFSSRSRDLQETEVAFLADCGIQIVRDREMSGWKLLQPKDSAVNAEPLRKVLELMGKHGLELMPVVGGMLWTNRGYRSGIPTSSSVPDWVCAQSKVVPGPMDGFNQRGSMPILVPEKLWRGYVRDLAEIGKGKIRIYEIMNEPFSFFTTGQYREYLNSAHDELKKADPACIILGACLTGDLKRNLVKDMASFLGSGKPACDAISFHPYNSLYEDSRDSGSAMFTAFRAQLRAAGCADMPLWNTELYYLNPKSEGGSDAFSGPVFHPGRLARRYLLDTANGAKSSILLTPGQMIDNAFNLNMARWNTFFKPLFLPNGNYIVTAILSDLLRGTRFDGIRMYESGETMCYRFSGREKAFAALFSLNVRDDDTRKLELPAPGNGVRYLDVFGNPLETRTFGATGIPVYIVARNSAQIERILDAVRITGVNPVRATAGRVCKENGTYVLRTAMHSGIAKTDSEATVKFGSVVRTFQVPAKTTLFRIESSELPEKAEFTVNGMRVRYAVSETLSVPLLPSTPETANDSAWKAAKKVTLGENRSVELGWRANTLFLRVRTGDRTPFRKGVRKLWEGDSVELFFDAAPFANMNDVRGQSPETVQLIFAPPAGKFKAIPEGGTSIHRKAIRWKFEQDADGSVFTAALPLWKLYADSAAPFAIDLKINDFGTDGKRLAEVSLSGRTDSYKNRMNFIILTLERN